MLITPRLAQTVSLLSDFGPFLRLSTSCPEKVLSTSSPACNKNPAMVRLKGVGWKGHSYFHSDLHRPQVTNRGLLGFKRSTPDSVHWLERGSKVCKTLSLVWWHMPSTSEPRARKIATNLRPARATEGSGKRKSRRLRLLSPSPPHILIVNDHLVLSSSPRTGFLKESLVTDTRAPGSSWYFILCSVPS